MLYIKSIPTYLHVAVLVVLLCTLLVDLNTWYLYMRDLSLDGDKTDIKQTLHDLNMKVPRYGASPAQPPSVAELLLQVSLLLLSH